MTARSALFDLYGDHLAARGGRAPVAALVRLLAPLDIAAPAVRTAVSRMVRQGWLSPVRIARAPGYELTPMAVRRLDETAARIYRVRRSDWDGHWHLVVIPRQHDRSSRERWRNALCFFGYAPLSECSWISPRRSAELDALLAAEGLRAERFAARHEGDSDAMVRRLWDLDGLSRCYERWLDQAKELISGLGEEPPDERAYAVRSRLVHGWRKFLFRDPALPGALLPDGWPGTRAAELFEEESGRLWPAASRFVDVCLNPEGPHEYPDQ